jgi:hypothetical protein
MVLQCRQASANSNETAMPTDTGATRFLSLAMLFAVLGLVFLNYLNS